MVSVLNVSWGFSIPVDDSSERGLLRGEDILDK